jgi:hypothetical protein
MIIAITISVLKAIAVQDV